MILIYFYDTCSLLRLQEAVFSAPFAVSSVTFTELEEIKSSGKKDEETKHAARKILRLLDAHADMYTIAIATNADAEWIKSKGLLNNADSVIIANAAMMSDSENANIEFVTDDLSCRAIARAAGLQVAVIPEEADKHYSGWARFDMDDEALAVFYENMTSNALGLYTNEYAMIERNRELVDVVKWDGTEYKRIGTKPLRTRLMDNIKPKDEYQRCAMDSIATNTMSLIFGKAGSGKSLISLASAMSLVDSGKYDRIIILSNPMKARGAADLGFYKGNRVEKLMANSIGEMLVSKFGDRYIVDQLIGQDKIRLISMADSRGMEIKDNEILYITECQNASIDLLKLCLTRASQGCKIILEGDFDAQVDSHSFEGANNGFKRAVEVFKGEPLVGVVELPNVWRSKIAELAQKM